MKKKRYQFFALLVSLFCFLVNGMTVVLAQEEQVDRLEFERKFKELGVAENVIDALYEKTLQGIVLDSMSEEYSNIQPSEIKYYEDGRIMKRYVYPDGSVRVVEIVPGKEICIQPCEIIPGEGTSGSGYVLRTGDKIIDGSGLLEVSFKADYIMTANDTCEILKVYDPHVACVMGAYSGEELLISKSTGTKANPATAYLVVHYNVTLNAATITYRLNLVVTPNGAHSVFDRLG